MKQLIKLVVIGLFILNAVPLHAEQRIDEEMETLKGKKIVMIIAAANFRDEELNVPLGYFETKGADVTVSSSVNSVIQGMLGAKVMPGKLYTEIDPVEYDAVVFVGGTGATQYFNDTVAHKIARDTLAKGKVLAAICLAPVTLANAGVLEGKKATVWPDPETEKVFNDKKVDYTRAGVEKDGKIITADGPSSAYKFAKEIESVMIKE